jgi:hypothetical protein
MRSSLRSARGWATSSNPSCIVSMAAVIACASLRPAAVMAGSRPPLSNSGVCRHCSSARSCLATAPSVTFSSAAAISRDPRRASASKQASIHNGGRRF